MLDEIKRNPLALSLAAISTAVAVVTLIWAAATGTPAIQMPPVSGPTIDMSRGYLLAITAFLVIPMSAALITRVIGIISTTSAFFGSVLLAWGAIFSITSVLRSQSVPATNETRILIFFVVVLTLLMINLAPASRAVAKWYRESGAARDSLFDNGDKGLLAMLVIGWILAVRGGDYLLIHGLLE